MRWWQQQWSVRRTGRVQYHASIGLAGVKDEYIPLSTRGARTRVIFTSVSLSHHFSYKRVHVVGVVFVFNRKELSQDIKHSLQKIQERFPGFRSWKLWRYVAIICTSVWYRWEYHQIDGILKVVKNVPPWKIPIGRLCPWNRQKPCQSHLDNRVSISPIYCWV